MSLYRAAKAVSVAGVTSVVALSVVLASGAIGAPTATHGLLAPPVLPLPGKPGYPPKLDGPAVASQEILPNLVAEFPGIPVTAADPGFPAVRQATIGGTTHNLLFFDSAFKNAGPGPVLVRGHRTSTNTRDMTADQYVELRDGSFALRRDVGALRYIYPTGIGLPHLHWHYLGAEVYAVYPVGEFGQFRRSHKQGFCMSEFPTDWTNYCGYKDPGELTQVVGMNPNTADYYGAGVEGQDIDVTGLRAGNYVLINWVDSTCELNERSYADNAASTAFTLQYPQGPNGPPALTLGAELNGVPHPPCPPPAMDGAQAAHYVQQAVLKRSGGPVAGLRFRCTRAGASAFTCPARWSRGAVAYAGRFAVSLVASTKLARYATDLAGISERTLFDGRASGHALRFSVRLNPLT